MAENESNPIASNGGTAPQAQLQIQKIYIKDASFEAPNAPQIFQEQGQPRIDLNLSQKVQNFAEGMFEVVLSLTVTCKLEDKTVYLAEVQQAGVFGLNGFEPGQRDAVLGTYCPHTLFPYARQAISDLVQNGGFPPFLLQPINFDQIYADQLKRRQEEAAAA
jgi:preprotein translocase subunit SecB